MSFLADRQAQLEVGHDHLGHAFFLVDTDFFHFGRRKCAHYELHRVVAEGNDVDLLAAQLGHDLPHSRAASAHAGANGIDAGIV